MQYLLLFLEGIITFVSPCILPLLPVYVSYFAGGGEKSTGRTLFNACGFVFGFTAVFMMMGALAGTAGGFLSDYRTAVNVVTGAVVVFFGLSFMGVFRIGIFKGSGTSLGTDVAGFGSAILLGVIFSIGWTPCVGTFLGTALMMASREGETFAGVVMLFVYSMGLGLPFILSAVLIDKLKGLFGFIKRNYKVVNIISGTVLIVLGVLMMTGFLDKILAFLS